MDCWLNIRAVILLFEAISQFLRYLWKHRRHFVVNRFPLLDIDLYTLESWELKASYKQIVV
jgi:hypothetical protein